MRILVALIAVLLPAGALATTTIDAGQRGRVDTRVGAAGFGGELLADDQPRVAPTVAVTSTVAPTPAVTVAVAAPTSLAPLPTLPGRTATTVPAVAATFPTPPGFPPLPMPTFPPNPPPNAWWETPNRLAVPMAIEPAAPVGGRPR